MPRRAGHIRIGRSGWNDPGWRGRFPRELRQRRQAARPRPTPEPSATGYSARDPI